MILRGWKAICEAAGGITPKTARKLTRSSGFPVAYIAGAPQTTDSLIEAWVEKHVKGNIGSLEGAEGSLEGTGGNH